MPVKLLNSVFVLIAVSVMEAFAVAGDKPVSSEYRVKAAFIYNFSRFIEWPAPGINASDNKHYLCVIGINPFGEFLQSLESKIVRDKLISIRFVNSVNGMKGCHVLYVGENAPVTINKINQNAYQNNILTVSDISGFARQGGVIQLLVADQKVRFEINLKAAKASQLAISSRLLKLARHIYKSGGA